jgi:acyl-coenzyme A synthetase/AMP-(fatty) acid ligase
MLLLDKQSADAVLVWHNGQPVTRAGFARAAMELAARLQLPSAESACINLCNGRLAFLLSLIAASICKRRTLLPPSLAGGVLQRLKDENPQHQIVDDSCLLDLDWATKPSTKVILPQLDPDAVALTLYTSGSTGKPQPHSKTWRSLARTGELDVQRFAPDKALNIVATVPSQHMYGLQTTVLMPLLGACAIHDSRPFFPADIQVALKSVPAPRALVTTPAHLRACIAAGMALPTLDFILSATAPLPLELAQQAEALWQTSVLEIYGATEAGTIATRRSAIDSGWTFVPGTKLQAVAQGTEFLADHLEAPVLLSDHIEWQPNGRFHLLGRSGDQIKIAGKRGSLTGLTQALLQIPGVRDGVFFLPNGADRVAALVTAPDVSAQTIFAALAHQVDAVFLPRPLLFLASLPRNETGKLTQDALQAALRNAVKL